MVPPQTLEVEQTEIGEIPEDWKVVILQDVCEWLGVGIASATTHAYTHAGVPILRNQNIKEGYIDSSDLLYINSGFDEKNKSKRIRAGDVISIRTGYPGLSAVVPQKFDQCQCFTTLISRPNHKILSSEFLCFWINSDKGKEFVLSGQAGGAQQNFNVGVLRKMPLPLPPIAEQKKIAEILGSVDDAIAATQAVIDQTRKVKQGLLQQLLTRGEYDKHNSANAAPLTLLDQVAQRVTGHTPNKSHPEYWNGGIKWVSLQDSAALDRVFIHKTAAEISEEGICNSSATKHPKGTVVLSRDAGVRKSAIITEEMAVSQHFIGWIYGSKLNNFYLYYWLQLMKPVFEEIAIGSTIKTIGMPFFRGLRIPLPPIDKQKRIANSLLSFDEKISIGEQEVLQLSELKRGLMQDLLTGRVRVGGVEGE